MSRADDLNDAVNKWMNPNEPTDVMLGTQAPATPPDLRVACDEHEDAYQPDCAACEHENALVHAIGNTAGGHEHWGDQ